MTLHVPRIFSPWRRFWPRSLFCLFRILFVPRILNYVVGAYLILTGIWGLGLIR
jgi:hypothetical protein